jgi:hypothetical protein
MALRYSFGDMIEKTLRYLQPVSEMAITLESAALPGATTLTVDGSSPFLSAIRPGTILGLDLEVFYVTNISSATLTVVPGFRGSTEAAHAAGTLIWINPRFTRFDIGQAINDELSALSSPDQGLGQILTTDITYIPAFQGYALPANFHNTSSKVMEISFAIAPPVRTFPLIRRNEYRVVRNQTYTSVFPNGAGIIIYRRAWPGFPIHVQYLSPFNNLTQLSDDATTVGGMPDHQQDIPPMGAMLRLATDREIGRNSPVAQPDPRKAPEIPPGAMANATQRLEIRYERRCNEERNRLQRAFPNAER